MPEGKKSTGVPMWVITFADLSTLMLTFFVLLISFANMDIVKFREMLGSVKGAFGVPEEKIGKAQPYLTGEEVFKEVEKEEKKTSISEEDRLEMQRTKEDMEAAFSTSEMKKNISVFTRKNEIVIRVDGGVFFRPGSTTVNQGGKKMLQDLATFLAKSDYFLTVEGHTDSTPINTERFPSNWELSGVRSTTILRYFLWKKISPDRLRAIGYSDIRPIADNDTEDGRARNRRVEFILKKPEKAAKS